MNRKKGCFHYRLPGQKKTLYGIPPGLNLDVEAIDNPGYVKLMASVVEQQIMDFNDQRPPNRNAVARSYLFDDTLESETYVFGFKFIMKYFGIDPEKARKAILENAKLDIKEMK